MDIFVENAFLFALLLLPLLLFLRLELVRKHKITFAVLSFVLTLAAGVFVLVCGGGMPEILLVVLLALVVSV